MSISTLAPMLLVGAVLPFQGPAEPIYRIDAHNWVGSISVSRDQKLMLTRGRDRGNESLKVWDLETKKLQRVFAECAGWFEPEIAPTSGSIVGLKAKYAMVAGGQARYSIGWEVRQANIKSGEVKILHSSDERGAPVAFWPDQEMVVTSGCQPADPDTENVLKFFDLKAKNCTVLPVGSPFEVIGFSPDRELVILKSSKGYVRVMDWKKKKKVAEMQAIANAGEELRACVILPGNKILLAMVSWMSHIQVWDLKTEKLSKTIPLQGSVNRKPELSPNGRLLATYGASGVYFFDTKAMKYIAEIETNEKAILNVMRFSPNGQIVIVGNNHGEIQAFASPKLGP